MANRLHIIPGTKSNKPKVDEADLGLQDYINDLLIEPVVKKESSLIKAVEKDDEVQKESLKKLKSITDKSSISEPQKKSITHRNIQQTKIEAKNESLKNTSSKYIEAAVSNQKNEPELNIARNFTEPDPRLQKVSKLLEKIATLPLQQKDVKTQTKEVELPVVENKVQPEVNVEVEVELVNQTDEHKEELIQATNENSFVQRENDSLRNSLAENFQTLIFDVNHLPLAVPLVKLGGIVNIIGQELTPLVGTPDWFLGLLPHERGNLMVVDTQQFLMPERPVKDERKYEYLIILDNSQWALACHSVGDAKNMQASDIRWSSKSSSRPWFAGMVVEYMSALIEVDSLINLLADQIVD